MCIPRIITDAPRIAEKLEAALHKFQTPDGPNGSLVTQETWEAWRNLKQHVIEGCLCDPRDVELNSFHEEKVVDGVRLPTVSKARGASALEGFHTHQKAWLGPHARHAGDVGEALLADGALRWNQRIHCSASKQSSIFAPGMRHALAAGCNHAPVETQSRS